jgi:hypothetical protein
MGYFMADWQELSDDELAERLKQRGMPAPIAHDWVFYRDTEGAVQIINRILEENE